MPHDLLERAGPAIVHEHQKVDVDVLEMVRNVPVVADRAVGGAVWRRLQAMVQSWASGLWRAAEGQ